MNVPAIIVHDLGHARAALAAAGQLGLPVTLLSPPAAAGYAGAAYFQAIIEQARTEHPDVVVLDILDCGDEPGLVLGAIRQGLKVVRFAGPRDITAKLNDIARQTGAVVTTSWPPALDLRETGDAEAACRNWLLLGAADQDG